MYGFDAFDWYVLSYASNQERLNILESYFIWLYDTTNRESGYNCTDGGSNGKLTTETIVRISKSKKWKKLSVEHRASLSRCKKGKWAGELNPRYGKGHTITGSNNPMFGKKHSKDTIEKIRRALALKPLDRSGTKNGMFGKIPKNTKPVIVYKNDICIGTFSSATSAAKQLGISQVFACRIANGTRKSPELRISFL